MGIRLTAVACNNCGAPLSIQDSTCFVTCSHCGSQLAVHRTDGSAFTEQIAAIHNHTHQIANDVSAIRRQAELDRLDQDWRLWKDRFTSGTGRIPDKAAAVVQGVIVSIFGLGFATVVSLLIGSGGVGLLVAGAIVTGGAVLGINEHNRANEYIRAEQAYRRKREACSIREAIETTIADWPAIKT